MSLGSLHSSKSRGGSEERGVGVERGFSEGKETETGVRK